MPDNMKVLLIIPAYNEEASIVSTCEKILAYNKENNTDYSFIVINDGSTDSTKALCEKNNLPVINLVQNLGIGGAVQTGYKYALKENYDIAIQFDGDGQHEVACVKDIIAPIIQGEADFVIGSRFISEDSENFKSTFMRRIGIIIVSFAIKLVTGKKVYDTTSGFRACNKAVIREFAQSYPQEYPEPVSTTALLKNGYIHAERPVKMNERTGGVSSIRAWKSVYYMINVLISILLTSKRRHKK